MNQLAPPLDNIAEAMVETILAQNQEALGLKTCCQITRQVQATNDFSVILPGVRVILGACDGHKPDHPNRPLRQYTAQVTAAYTFEFDPTETAETWSRKLTNDLQSIADSFFITTQSPAWGFVSVPAGCQVTCIWASKVGKVDDATTEALGDNLARGWVEFTVDFYVSDTTK